MREWGSAGSRWIAAVAAIVVTLATSVVLAVPANAALSGATSTTTTDVVAGQTTPLAGLAVAAADGDSLDVHIATTSGTLSIDTSSGITLSYGYDASGAEIAFTGTGAQVNAALATVTVTADAADRASTAEISIVARPADGYVYSSQTEHFYEFVPASNISWADARAAAAARPTYGGQSGYLATVPSAEVNDLVTSKIPGALNVWLGAQAVDNVGGYARVWEWTDGPLAGDVFTRCSDNASYVACDYVDSSGFYSNWSAGEPNNAEGIETNLVTNWISANGYWNDLPGSYGGIDGYVVEYGDLPLNTTGGFDGIYSATSTVNVWGAPDAPALTGTVSGEQQIQVAFNAPAFDGGGAIDSYRVTVNGGGSAVCASSPCTVTGLAPSTYYSLTVAAHNTYGWSAESATAYQWSGGAPSMPAEYPADLLVGYGVDFYLNWVAYPSPTVAITGGSLPDGIVLDTSNGRIYGTPTTEGPYDVTVTVTNIYGSSSTHAYGTVQAPPVVQSTTLGALELGAPVDVTLVASGIPSATWSVTGGALPAGLALASDGRVTGTPTAAGAYSVDLRAANAWGSNTRTFSGTVFSVPDAPAIVSTTSGNQQIQVSFTPSAIDGGAAVDSFRVTVDGGATVVCASSPCTIAGLAPSTFRSLTVAAHNAYGWSAESAVVNEWSGGAPSIPAEYPANLLEGSGVDFTLDWIAYPAPTVSITAGSLPDGIVLDESTGRIYGTATTEGPYDVTVTVTNIYGSSSTHAYGTVEAASRVLTANLGALTWGSPVDIALVASGIPTATWSVTSGALPDGLTLASDGRLTGTPTMAGIYTVEVAATNGWGIDRRVLTGTVDPIAPQAPALTSAQGADGAAVLTVALPSNTGGGSLVTFEYSTDGGSTWTASPQGAAPGEFTVTGLTNGVTYPVATRLVTSGGTGPASEVLSVMPFTAASAPVITEVTPHAFALTVTFDAPASDGGYPILGYRYSTDGGTTWSGMAPGATSPLTIYGLANGVAYDVRVRAVTSIGDGVASDPVQASPVSEPVSYDRGLTSHPSLTPGASAGFVDGQTTDGTATAAGDAWEVTNGDVTMLVAAYDNDDELIAQSGEVAYLKSEQGGYLMVSGDGFEPGSQVDVWMFSTPAALGTLTVAPDGSVSGYFPIPTGLELGSHTVQANGVSASGHTTSTSMGLVLAEHLPPLAMTGFDGVRLVVIAVPLALVGAAMLLWGRRRDLAAGPARHAL